MRVYVTEEVRVLEQRFEELRSQVAGFRRAIGPIADAKGIRFDRRFRHLPRAAGDVGIFPKAGDQTDWRLFYGLRLLEDRHEVVACVLLAARHGDGYERIRQDPSLVEDSRARLVDAQILRAIDAASATEEPALRPPAPEGLLEWLVPPHELAQVFLPHRRIEERASWSNWTAYLAPDEVRSLQVNLRAVLNGAPVAEAPFEATWNPAGTVLSLLGPIGTTSSEQVSRRYAMDVLTEDDLAWPLLQGIRSTSADPCLPLDQGEVDILDTPRGRRSFPMFIDGPAGSGKSTVLTYLAAGFVQRSLASGSDLLPLLTTLSPQLVDDARARLSNQLQVHFRHGQKAASELAVRTCLTVDDVLRQLVGEEGAGFESARAVTFGAFRRWYEKSIGRSTKHPDATAALTWAVFRSGVFGGSIADLEVGGGAAQPRPVVDPEQLRPLLRHLPVHDVDNLIDHSVRVVASYQEWLSERGLWDPQELAVAAIVARSRSQDHDLPWAALLCDEAQDLTRVQLQALSLGLRQSRFDLGPARDDRSLLAVFAADPFQAVNPSGFTWASLQEVTASLAESWLDSPPSERRPTAPRRLQSNHRSPEVVVGVANAVQHWRGTMRSSGVVEDQRSARADKGVAVVGYRPLGEEDLRRLVAGAAVIVPASPDDTDGFLDGDRWLGRVLPEGQRAFVYSPVDAKGQQFSQPVVAYGFGTALVELEATRSAGTGDTELLAANLYVAVTRPERSLVVIDDGDGARRLAEVLDREPVELDPEVIEEAYAVADGGGQLRTALAELRMGLVTDDDDRCRRAAEQFDQLNRSPDAAVARWCTSLLRSELSPPSEDLDVANEAGDVLIQWAWESECWPVVIAVTADDQEETIPSLAQARRAAALMALDRGESRHISVLTRFFADPPTRIDEPIWERARRRLLESVVSVAQAVDRPRRDWWSRLGRDLDRIEGFDDDVRLPLANAWTAAAAGNLPDALAYADLIGSDDDDLRAEFVQQAFGLGWIPRHVLGAHVDDINVAELTRRALRHRPELAPIGFAALPEIIDRGHFDRVGLVVVEVAMGHINEQLALHLEALR